MAHGQIDSEYLELDEENLVELSLLNERVSSAKNIQVAQFSDSEDIKKLNYYLFSEVSDIDFYTVDSLTEDELQEMDEMDVIVFNKDNEKLKEMLLLNIKAKNLNTKFFLISNKDYLRQKDILKEHINGVDKYLKIDFFLEDYILSMEKFLRSNFYSKRLLSHEDAKDVLMYDKKKFKAKIDELIEKRIFFSTFSYKFDSEMDIEGYNIKKIVRECDLICIDKKKSELTFLLLNVVPEFGTELIKKRINNFSITLEEKDKLSAFDIIYEN
jgi:hypothetical protein